jgi:hypothetical protein
MPGVTVGSVESALWVLTTWRVDAQLTDGGS